MQNIMPGIFETIVVPEQVVNEIDAGSDAISQQIKEVEWLSVKKVSVDEGIVEWNLGKGETAVIS